MQLKDIDKNFQIDDTFEGYDFEFYNVLEKPFKIYGVFYEDGQFRRLSKNVAKSVSEGVSICSLCTAGGRVRFSTDSDYFAICAKIKNPSKTSHMSLAGSTAFDLYKNINGEELHMATFIPPYNVDGEMKCVRSIGNRDFGTITINFPPYCEVEELYIGIEKGKKLEEPLNNYVDMKPIVYYGSSITQGACASRPGNNYENQIVRRNNCDYINLGFSGNAKAEDSIIDYIKKLPMSIFVYDYDFNAPDVEYLQKTHYKGYLKVRQENKDLPIIMMSQPRYYTLAWVKERLEVIENSYKKAIESGDKNVYFISGKELVKYTNGDCLVDVCHPNDLGFYSMAKVLGDKIEEILNKKG